MRNIILLGLTWGFALLMEPAQPWIPWVLFAAYGLYSAFTDGAERALVSDLAPAEMRATALGLHATLVGIGLLPASLLAGQLWVQIGPEAALGLGGATGFIAAIAVAILL